MIKVWITFLFLINLSRQAVPKLSLGPRINLFHQGTDSPRSVLRRPKSESVTAEEITFPPLECFTENGVILHQALYVNSVYNPNELFKEHALIGRNGVVHFLVEDHSPSVFEELNYRHWKCLFLYLLDHKEGTVIGMSGWNEERIRRIASYLTADDISMITESAEGAYLLGVFFKYLPTDALERAKLAKHTIIDLMCMLRSPPITRSQEFDLAHLINRFTPTFLTKLEGVISYKLGFSVSFRGGRPKLLTLDASERFFIDSGIVPYGVHPFTPESFHTHSATLFRDLEIKRLKSFIRWVRRHDEETMNYILSFLTRKDAGMLCKDVKSCHKLGAVIESFPVEKLDLNMEKATTKTILSEIPWRSEIFKRFSGVWMDKHFIDVMPFLFHHFPPSMATGGKSALRRLPYVKKNQAEEAFIQKGLVFDGLAPFTENGFKSRSKTLMMACGKNGLANLLEWMALGGDDRVSALAHSITGEELIHIEESGLIHLAKPLFHWIKPETIMEADLEERSMTILLEAPTDFTVLEKYPRLFFQNRAYASVLIQTIARNLLFDAVPKSVLQMLWEEYKISAMPSAWTRISCDLILEDQTSRTSLALSMLQNGAGDLVRGSLERVREAEKQFEEQCEEMELSMFLMLPLMMGKLGQRREEYIAAVDELLEYKEAWRTPAQFPETSQQPAERMCMCSSVGGSQSFEDRDILPRNVKPSHYDVHIDSDLEKFTFHGRVKIQIDVLEATKEISLNAQEMSGFKAKVVQGEKELEGECVFDEAQHVLTVKLGEELSAGSKVELEVEFDGEINDKMAGYYRSSYKDSVTGEKKFMMATQFEATDCRKAFPCWDEPNVKATFDITLVAPKDQIVLSNMGEKGRAELEDGRVAVSFERSPIMSTYLVAWVIGDLESIEEVNSDGVKVKVWAPKGSVEQGKFALDVACKTLAFFSEYFGIAYPLPKMDMVAVPDFSAGAMENWGLVTYRTAALLFDEANSSLKSKQRICYVVCHELAHQWFGNLVTMDWWSDLWLNEGFATWVGWLAADRLFPEWDVWTEFVVDDCQAGLGLDCLRSSHPIEVPVKNPEQIGQIFDSISYSKGASLIRQLVALLGQATFQTGLRAYLQKHRYGNARTKDLWESLAEASGLPVASIMASWTQSIGYPVVTVEVVSGNEEGEEMSLRLVQNRFLLSGDVAKEEDETLWAIPLRLGTDTESLRHTGSDDLLREREMSLTVPKDASFVKLNMGQAGFYRVAYPTALLNKLGAAVAAGKLSTSDRIGLVADSFALSTAGKIPVTSVLELLGNFRDEQDFLVWSEITSRLSDLLSVWWEEPANVQASLKSFIASLCKDQVALLGFDASPSDTDKTRLLRPMVIGMAARCGDAAVVAEAQKRFKSFCAGDSSSIHPNLRGTVYGTVIREGGQEEWKAVLDLYNKLTVPDQKLAALSSLGYAAQPELIQQMLGLTLDDQVVRPQDVIYILRTAGVNPASRRATWSWVKENWDAYTKRYALGGGISLLGRIVSSATDALSSPADEQDVLQFFAARPIASIDQSVRQSVEKIKSNAAWLERNRKPVADWFAQ